MRQIAQVPSYSNNRLPNVLKAYIEFAGRRGSIPPGKLPNFQRSDSQARGEIVMNFTRDSAPLFLLRMDEAARHREKPLLRGPQF
jgi:hypothetical protein